MTTPAGEIAREVREGTRAIAVTGICRDGGGYGLGIAAEGEPGYWPFRERLSFATYEAACAEARRINTMLGLTEREAVAVILSSMRAQNVGSVAELARRERPREEGGAVRSYVRDAID